MLIAAITLVLRLHDPTVNLEHHYTVADYSSDNLYTVEDWEKTLDKQQTCQCIEIKVHPNGTISQKTHPCICW